MSGGGGPGAICEGRRVKPRRSYSGRARILVLRKSDSRGDAIPGTVQGIANQVYGPQNLKHGWGMAAPSGLA